MIILEILAIVVLLSGVAWLFGVDGEKIASFYIGMLWLCGIIALFAGLTAYFLKLMGACQ